jgi:2-dehydro-3-deoxygluconokinase
VSCDLNFRKKLWTSEEANRVMSGLMPYVDLCIANEEDAHDVFGISAKNTDIAGGQLDHDAYIDVAKQLSDRFGFKRVAITLRESLSASVNNWAGMLYAGGEAYLSPKYTIQIVDRVGGGDSFGGSLIYALMEGYDPQRAINFAVAGSCLKHTIEHDFDLVSVAEVETLAGGDASGRVQR